MTQEEFEKIPFVKVMHCTRKNYEMAVRMSYTEVCGDKVIMMLCCDRKNNRLYGNLEVSFIWKETAYEDCESLINAINDYDT